MRLKTQFIITMLLFGIILVAIAASAIITNRQTSDVMEQERRSLDIAQGADDIGYLANDYLIHREELQLRRWQKRFVSFTGQVASLHVTRPEQQSLVANIEANKKRLKEVFDNVVSADGNLPRNKRRDLDLQSLQVSWSRMAVQIRGLTADASRLTELLRQQRDELTNKRTMLIYVLVGLFGIFLIVSFLQTYRRVLKSLVTLRDSAAVIGSGNLDFKIEEKKDDEIGDLSRAFNRMTSDLKAVTASKAELEREITARKEAEERIRRGTILLNQTGKLAKVGGWEIDVATMTQNWTDETYEIHGVDRQTYNPNVDREISSFSPESKPFIEKAVYDAINCGTPYDLDLEFITASGIHKMTRAIGNAEMENGKVKRVYGIFQDVTEQKRAEAALRESEDRFFKAFRLSPIAMAIQSFADRRLVEVNESFLTLFGYSREEVIGRTSGELDMYSDPGKRAAVMPLFDNGSIRNYEMILLTKNAAFVDVLCSAEKVSLNGQDHLISTLIDITDRKLAESQLAKQAALLQERTALLEETNRELESYSYSVSHDLRAPLRAIEGFSRIILKQQGDKFDENTRRQFNLIRDNTKIMGNLIDDLLSFSRVQKTGMNIAMIDMDNLAGEVRQEMLAANRERELEIGISKMLPGCGDQVLIRQVLVNLFSNAVKFTQGRKPGIIEITSYQEPGQIVYRFRDNGVGFDMAYYDRLFGVFQRLHSREEYEGTGVGLAIVQRIINRHGGRVWAEGKVNEGAAFYFSLPERPPVR